MRFAQTFSSLLLITSFAVAACGGSAPPAATPTDAPAAAAAESNDDASTAEAPAHEDESWSGEGSSKEAPSKDPAAASTAAASAEPAPADGKAPETRTMDVIRKLVVENRKAARKCYDDARKDLKDLKGDVVIHFVLDPEGKVKSAELNQERSTLKSPVVVDCVIGVIRGIHFPKSSRAMETSTNYPFNFTP